MTKFWSSWDLRFGENFEVIFGEGCMRSIVWNLPQLYRNKYFLPQGEKKSFSITTVSKLLNYEWMVFSDIIGADYEKCTT